MRWRRHRLRPVACRRAEVSELDAGTRSSFYVPLLLHCSVCRLCRSDGQGTLTPPGPFIDHHNEDYCGTLYGALNDQSQNAFGFPPLYTMCETEIQPLKCPAGWAHYLDDGSEGVDSCLWLSTYTVANWKQASVACPAGSHLLTLRSTGPFTLLTYATSLYQVGIASMYIGCSQPSGAGLALTGWAWVDGTSAANLNCGSTGCGAWATGLPGYVSGC